MQKPSTETNEESGWMPTDLTPMVRVTLQGHEGQILIPLTKQWVADGTEDMRELCSACGDGLMVARKGKYGDFLGCTNYPKCKNTKNIDQVINQPSPRARTRA